MNKPGFTSLRRALRILAILKGHTLDGVSNREIAEALDESPANVSRALAVMEEEGFVNKLETGRWGHSVMMLQIAQAHVNHIANAQDRILEINQRVTAGA